MELSVTLFEMCLRRIVGHSVAIRERMKEGMEGNPSLSNMDSLEAAR